MKTIRQIKEEVLENSKQPQNFYINLKKVHGKTYEVEMVCGLLQDYERLVKTMKREGYTVFS
jgi:hypothetical protein